MRRCVQLLPLSNFLLPLFFLFTFLQATAQDNGTKKVTGKVTDATGSPVPGATVAVKGTDVKAIARADGSFSLPVSSNNFTLVISSVGYETKEVAVTNPSSAVSV